MSDLRRVEAERDRLRKLSDRWNKAIMPLTVQGSEYYNEPERCAENIQWRQEQHDKLERKKREKVEAERDRLRDALVDMRETLLSNCVKSEVDETRHVAYNCIGQYGYGCRCFAEDSLKKTAAALGEGS